MVECFVCEKRLNTEPDRFSKIRVPIKSEAGSTKVITEFLDEQGNPVSLCFDCSKDVFINGANISIADFHRYKVVE